MASHFRSFLFVVDDDNNDDDEKVVEPNHLRAKLFNRYIFAYIH